MVFRLMVLCCVAALLSPMWALGATTQDAVLMPSLHGWQHGSLDDPQPDTLRYDDNTPALLNTATNFWTRVKFNAPNNFELRSIYFFSTNGDGGAEACSIFVHAANGDNLGAVLSGYRKTGNVANLTWNDTNLPTPVQIAAGDSFYVVIGPCPGGQQSAGWHVIMDNANGGRSGYSSTGHNGTWILPPNPNAPGGDYMVRAGGAVETFIDLEGTECYNSVGADPLFNMLTGDTVALHALVTNTGNSNVPLYTVAWSVAGPGGGNVYTHEVTAGPINDGAVQTVNSGTTFVASQAGEYLVTCTIDADGDAVGGNNVTKLRFFAGGLHRWYRYDDNQDPDSYVGFITGSGWGVSFAPTLYTAKVESIRVAVDSPGNGDFRLYLNDDQTGMPAGDPLWSGTPAVVAGWNTIAINPPVQVFSGQMITLAYLYSGLGFGKDDTAPNDAGITSMGAISWQASDDGATWNPDLSGNWAMQLYVDTSSALPPFALIATNLDTLQFGSVDTTGATSVTLTLWIYNQGGSDPLAVSNMQINPAGQVRNAYHLSRTSIASIAAGDSASVDITFNPTAVGAHNGLLVLTNNSQNLPTKNVLVRGQGIAGSAADDPRDGMPNEYALTQNFPNPFNPSTDISFALPQASDVKLAVFNMLGQQVAVLATGTFEAGWHSVNFDAANLPAGLYFYRIEANDFTAIKKMMLLK